MSTSKLVPTPQARDWKGAQGRSYKGEAKDLPGEVMMLPTPGAQDWKKRGPASKQRGVGEVVMDTTLPLLREDFPASPLAPQDVERERTMTAISGQKCSELYKLRSPTGSLQKMCEVLLHGQTAWYSRQCALTWKAKVTKSNRLLFQLSPSARPTGGTGSGLLGGVLPTPRVSETEGAPVKNAEFNGKSWSRTNAKGVRYGVKVKDVVETLNHPQPLLPTPNTMESLEPKKLESIVAHNQKARPGRSYLSMNLRETVAYGKRTLEGAPIPIGRETGKKLRLQPAMTQWMMGYPDLWTEFPKVTPNGDKTASKPTATE